MEYAGTAHKKKFNGSDVRPLEKYDEGRERSIDERRKRPVEPHESKASAASALGEKIPRSVYEGCR